MLTRAICCDGEMAVWATSFKAVRPCIMCFRLVMPLMRIEMVLECTTIYFRRTLKSILSEPMHTSQPLGDKEEFRMTHGHVGGLKEELAERVQQVGGVGARPQRQTQVGQEADQTLLPQVLVRPHAQRGPRLSQLVLTQLLGHSLPQVRTEKPRVNHCSCSSAAKSSGFTEFLLKKWAT